MESQLPPASALVGRATHSVIVLMHASSSPSVPHTLGFGIHIHLLFTPKCPSDSAWLPLNLSTEVFPCCTIADLGCFTVLVCVQCIRVWVGVCVGVYVCVHVCIWRPEFSIHVLYYFLPFFSLLLCFTFKNFIHVYNEYIYCFPFHSVLIVTKCPLCNFMGLSLLSFCFANPLSPVGAVDMFIGVEPFPGGWESTNGQTRTILSPQQLIPVHSSLWGGGGWKASHSFSLECWSSWVCVGFLCQ